MHDVIIDTDPGHDDALAIMLAVKSNMFNIHAITTVAGNVSYFPNPASERFTISNGSGEAFDAIVYDLNGRVITKASATRGNNVDVNAASMKAGIYIIRVTDQNNRLLSTGKMVIKP